AVARRSTVSRVRPFAVRGFATGSTYRVTLAVVDPANVTVIDAADLDAGDRAALIELVARAAGSGDGHPPLPDPQLWSLTRAGEAGAIDRAVLARTDGRLDGAAFVSSAHDGSTVLHTVVDRALPDGSGVTATLLERAIAAAPAPSTWRLWSMKAGPD